VSLQTSGISPARATRAVGSYWGSTDIAEVAQRVLDEVLGQGCLLPYTKITGRPVFPVVQWLAHSLSRRNRSGVGPLTSLRTLSQVLDDPTRSVRIPAPLRIIAFISVSPLSSAGRDLAGLRTVCRTIVACPGTTVPGPLAAADYDYRGTTIAAYGEDGVRVIVDGDPGVRPGSGLDPFWLRFRQEQMFSLAVRSGYRPTGESCPAAHQAPR
jgi:hypothetical protein